MKNHYTPRLKRLDPTYYATKFLSHN